MEVLKVRKDYFDIVAISLSVGTFCICCALFLAEFNYGHWSCTLLCLSLLSFMCIQIVRVYQYVHVATLYGTRKEL